MRTVKKKVPPERESSDIDESEMMTQSKYKFEKRSENILVLIVIPL